MFNFHSIRWLSFVLLLLSMAACTPRTPIVAPQIDLSEVSADLYSPDYRPSFQMSAPRQEIAATKFKRNTPRPIVIMIDPGHGGEDLGTTSTIATSYHEKAANLATAQVLQTYLQQLGFHTMMTRHRDVFVSLQQRSQFANEQNVDLFVSVHYNSAPAPQAHGIEVFYYNSSENKERAKASKALAENVLENVIALTGARSRGVKHGNLAVIRETKMPAILIEGGFFTNADEFAKIKDQAYIKKIARGIAQGVIEYTNRDKLVLGAN